MQSERKWIVIYIVGVLLWLLILSSSIYFADRRPPSNTTLDFSSITLVLIAINIFYTALSLFVSIVYIMGIKKVKDYQRQAIAKNSLYPESSRGNLRKSFMTAADKIQAIANNFLYPESSRGNLRKSFMTAGDKIQAIANNFLYPESNKSNNPLCTIIIPARNEEAVIRQSVLGCLKQTYKNIEVIVVSHNSTDKTVENAQVRDGRVKALNLVTKESGKALALNYGVKNASGEYIMIIDADHVLKEDFIECAMPLLLGDTYAAVQGNIRSINRGYNLISRLASMEDDLWTEPFLTARHLFGRRCPLCGTGFIIRKDVLQEVGMFSNNLVEDAELTYRLLRAKHRMAFAPLSVIYGEEPTSLPMIIRQRARWGRGFISLLKHPIELRDILGNLYWALPAVSYIGYLITSILGFATLYFFIFGRVPYTFSTVTLNTWLVLLGINIAMFFILHLRLFGKNGLKHAIYLPLYMVYSQYSFSSAMKALFVKSWSNNKTVHGFVKVKPSEQQQRQSA